MQRKLIEFVKFIMVYRVKTISTDKIIRSNYNNYTFYKMFIR